MRSSPFFRPGGAVGDRKGRPYAKACASHAVPSRKNPTTFPGIMLSEMPIGEEIILPLGPWACIMKMINYLEYIKNTTSFRASAHTGVGIP